MNWLQIKNNKLFFLALLILIVVNIIGSFNEQALFVQYTKSLFVPIFLIFFFISNKVIGIPFILFLLFFFLGDASSMFFANDIVINASSMMYFLGYLCLIFIIAPKFRFVEFDKIIGVYLLLVVAINVFFLYTLYGILKAILPDSLEVVLFGIKNMSLIVLLVITFGVYLNNDTKLSILFLLMALCFGFSDVLHYVNHYYIYNWSFAMIDTILYAIGLFFLFNSILEFNKVRKKLGVKQERITSEKILA